MERRDQLGKQRGYVRHVAAALLMLSLLSTGHAAETVTLNFKDTDLTAVIGAVSEMTGENFIVDPRVKGKVTVISSQPMSADEVYQVFLSVLKVHGFSAIPGDMKKL